MTFENSFEQSWRSFVRVRAAKALKALSATVIKAQNGNINQKYPRHDSVA